MSLPSEAMILGLTITSKVRCRLIDVTLAAAPMESCGLLVGEGGFVERVAVLKNAASSIGRFVVLKADCERVKRIAIRDGQEILAIFHSHPSGDCGLSSADRAGLRHSPVPWVIIAVEGSPTALSAQAYQPGSGESLPVTIG